MMPGLTKLQHIAHNDARELLVLKGQMPLIFSQEFLNVLEC